MKEERVQAMAPKSPERRKFIGKAGVTGAITIAGIVGVEPLLKSKRSNVQAAPAPGSNQRANDCAKLRRDAAQAGLVATPQNLQHPTNTDESLYANKAGSYSKGLPHNSDGTVVLSAYQQLVAAINSESAAVCSGECHLFSGVNRFLTALL